MVDDDENVIPFPGPVTWARLGSAADLSKPSTAELIAAIEAYEFTCPGGPLAGCAEWVELKHRLRE
jgi:hypothetical protein